MEEQTVTLLPIPGDYGSMYDFFCQCERDNKTVTIPEIRDLLFAGKDKTARRHVSSSWSWFLVRVDQGSVPYVFKVQGLRDYPRSYFIDGHNRKQRRYLHHFVESKSAYENRKKMPAHSLKKSSEYNQQSLPMETAMPEEKLVEEPVESSVSSVEPDEDSEKQRDPDIQPPARRSRRLLWYTTCAVVAAGVIIAYVVFSSRK